MIRPLLFFLRPTIQDSTTTVQADVLCRPVVNCRVGGFNNPMKKPDQYSFLKKALFSAAMLLTLATQAGQGPQPPICNRSCWVARAPRSAHTQMASLNRAIIHHTAGSSDYTTDYETGKAKVRGVQNVHMDANGWSDIGYHFLVNAGGHIYEGRSGSLGSLPKGAHDGYNVNSFGFTLLGYFHTPYNQTPPSAMRSRLYDVIAWRMPSAWSSYGSGSYNGVTVGTLDGHRKVKATACPGDLMHNNYITANYSGGEARTEVNARKAGSPGSAGNRKGIARTPNGGGYWIVASDGGVFSFGNAMFYGSVPGAGVSVNNVVGICARPQGDGYWIFASDGGVFCFGGAPFHGSMGGQPLNQPIVGMACTADGNGYWLVGKDGGIFAFNAPFHGSLGSSGYTDIVGMAAAWNGSNGYWIVRQGGSIYSYGAGYYGGGEAGSGVVGIAANSNGTGYWQTRNNGAIYTYGTASYAGGANQTTFVGIARGPSNNGYWLVKSDGAVFSFGDAQYHGGANY